MSAVRLRATLKVRPGKLDGYRDVVRQVDELTRNESGNLYWDCYYEESTELAVFMEAYEDSAALLAHYANVAHLFPLYDDVSDMKGPLEIYGELSAEANEAVKASSPRIFGAL
jgi:quinol monooxygenase YgiN